MATIKQKVTNLNISNVAISWSGMSVGSYMVSFPNQVTCSYIAICTGIINIIVGASTVNEQGLHG